MSNRDKDHNSRHVSRAPILAVVILSVAAVAGILIMILIASWEWD
jgi:hypothetical protein